MCVEVLCCPDRCILTVSELTCTSSLHLTSQNTFFFHRSNKPVPVFTHKAFHIQKTLKDTLFLFFSLSHTHKHTPRYQTLKDMNHKQLTSSGGLNERHASIRNIRIKASFCSFSLFFLSVFYFFFLTFPNLFNSVWRWISDRLTSLTLDIDHKSLEMVEKSCPHCVYMQQMLVPTLLLSSVVRLLSEIFKTRMQRFFLWLHCYIRCKHSCCLVHHLYTFVQNLNPCI